MIISFFKDEWSTYSPAEMMLDLSWDNIAEKLTTFIKVKTKEETEMYNLWEFKVDNEMIHRCKDDCVALHGLVIDYDNNLTLNDAIEQFYSFGFECVIYTTFNHSPAKDKFRVVLPFSKTLTAEEFSRKRKSIIESFPGADRASFSRSQAIFLHSGPDETQAFSCRLPGQLLDPTIFEDEIFEPIKPAEVREDIEMDPDFKQRYRTAIINSLMSCKGFRHLNALSVVIMLKSCGATFEDYQRIVAVAGDPDSHIQHIKSQKEAWAAVPNDALISGKKRNEFISRFGGKPVKMERADEPQLTRQLKSIKERLKKRNGNTV